jgi:CheY-like chemotaxis protein
MPFVEEVGFIAVEASNADEAIRILETNPDIRIIITDIDMPGSMNGIDLAQAVCDRWPPVVVLITSGYRKPEPMQLPANAWFFAKPSREQRSRRRSQRFSRWLRRPAKS